MTTFTLCQHKHQAVHAIERDPPGRKPDAACYECLDCRQVRFHEHVTARWFGRAVAESMIRGGGGVVPEWIAGTAKGEEAKKRLAGDPNAKPPRMQGVEGFTATAAGIIDKLRGDGHSPADAAGVLMLACAMLYKTQRPTDISARERVDTYLSVFRQFLLDEVDEG